MKKLLFKVFKRLFFDLINQADNKLAKAAFGYGYAKGIRAHQQFGTDAVYGPYMVDSLEFDLLLETENQTV